MENDNNTTAPNPNADLLARIEALEKGHAALTAENAALRKGLKAAETPAKEKPKPVIPTQTFQVGRKTYKFIVPAFRIGDKDMTATDALTDEELLADLVHNESGIITEVTA